MPDRVYLHPIDPELLPGAHNAIHTCLRLKPQERITIITDTVTRGIAAALAIGSGACRVGVQFVCPGASCATAALLHARDYSGRPGALAGLGFRRTSSARRTRLAHGNDGSGEPSPNPARSHGEH